MEVVLVIVGLAVLFAILYGVETIMQPVGNAFADVIERMLNRLEEEFGDAPTLIVPLQIGAAVVAVVSVIIMVTAGAAGFFLGLFGLVAAACLYDLARRLTRRAEFPRHQRSTSPSHTGGQASSTRSASSTPALRDAGASPEGVSPASESAVQPLTTYTTTPPTAEAVRRRVRLAELQQAPSLSPSDEAELDVLMARDADSSR
ncbi:MAG TPA: hypothetical protein PKB03_01765 [Baekduia sp.]|nr:hypothetical protein [Baekduia sp.]